MQQLDWIILCVTLLSIVVYGVYKTKGSKNVEEYILGNKETIKFSNLAEGYTQIQKEKIWRKSIS